MKNLKMIKTVPVNKPTKIKRDFPISDDYKRNLEQSNNEKIQISFAMTDLSHDFFNLGGTCNKWSQAFLESFHELCKISKKELLSGRYEDRFRPHKLEWNELDFEFNISHLEQYECRQISLSSSRGRIHGVFIGNVFYIVWVDPQHYLYHDSKFGPRRKIEPPETCCQRHDEVIKELYEKIEEYENLLDELTEPKKSE